jgi:hypothetical protein
MRVFFDSSAFAKRYIAYESGTQEVIAWCERADELALSVIAVPELVAAFCRLRRDGAISVPQYRRLKEDFMADIADVLICDTTPQVLQHAVAALERYPLGAMDAIHLGAAVACASDVFVSADRRQCAAAKAIGLAVSTI